MREPPTAHERWVLLHGGQSSISLEYQTYTSAHLFDTLVIVVTTGIKQSSNIDSALVSAMYGQSSELGLST